MQSGVEHDDTRMSTGEPSREPKRAVMNETKNGLDFLVQEHIEIKDLFKSFEIEQNPHAKKKIFDKLAEKIIGHGAAEQRFLFPLIQQHITNGKTICEVNEVDDRVNKDLIASIGKLDATRDGQLIEVQANKLKTIEEKHLIEEEKMFDQLRAFLSPAQQKRLFDDLTTFTLTSMDDDACKDTAKGTLKGKDKAKEKNESLTGQMESQVRGALEKGSEMLSKVTQPVVGFVDRWADKIGTSTKLTQGHGDHHGQGEQQEKPFGEAE